MLTRYDVFDDVTGLKSLIDGYFNARPASGGHIAEPPLVNIYEQGDTVTAIFQTPGLQTKDIDCKIVDTVLTVSAKREKDPEKGRYVRRERSFGSFTKNVRLPFRVNPDSIQASLKDGLLTVTLDKSEDAKPKKIVIQ